MICRHSFIRVVSPTPQFLPYVFIFFRSSSSVNSVCIVFHLIPHLLSSEPFRFVYLGYVSVAENGHNWVPLLDNDRLVCDKQHSRINLNRVKSSHVESNRSWGKTFVTCARPHSFINVQRFLNFRVENDKSQGEESLRSESRVRAER